MCAKPKVEDMPYSLIQRPDGKSRNWVVRLVAPQDIAHLVPQKDIRKSTGTADKKEAEVYASQFAAKVQADWHELRQLSSPLAPHVTTPRALSPTLISQICGARLQAWIDNDNEERVEVGINEAELAEIEEFCRVSEGEMRSILAQGRGSRAWPTVVDTLLEWCWTLQWEISPTDPQFPQLVREYASVEKKAQEFIAARNRGEDVEEPIGKQQGGRTLSEVVPEYEKAFGHAMARGTLTTKISHWNALIEYRGDVSLDSVESRDIFGFLHERLHAEETLGDEDYTNGKMHATLVEFFGLARTLNMMRGSNPARELEVKPRLSKEERASRKKRRHPFDSQQMSKIFASAWYDPKAENWRGKMGEDLAGRYWAPLIMTIHGLRVTESVQFVNSDFTFDSGIMVMSIQREIDGGVLDLPPRRIKNSATLRSLPVHPVLIEQGFEQFVRRHQEEHPLGTPLFPSAIPDEGGEDPKWGRSFEQAFLRFLSYEMKFGKGFGNHSFRHQFEDRLRDAQSLGAGKWPPGLAQFYSGRTMPRDYDREFFAATGSEVSYGKGYGPEHVVPYLTSISFADITLPPPYQTWLKKGRE